jgi:hypothetical protein
MGYRSGAGRQPHLRLLRGVVAAAIAGVGLLTLTASSASAAGTPLVGTFTINAGSCSGGSATGTYLRMVLSGGSNASGPYFSNSDSTCSDNSYTPLAPGSAGGLVTGSYQPQPSPAFDSSGNALAHQITSPVAFEGVKFGTATNPTDPQTGLKVPVPSIVANGSSLSGNLEAFGVSWNNQEFNQGSPKPDGTSPANTTPVTGTYNASTGAYTLQWSSQVVGGPFNGFSAFWNLTGRFIAAAAASTSTAPPAASTSAGTQPSTAAGSASKASAATSAGTAAAATSAGTASTTTTTAGTTSTTVPATQGSTHVVESSRTFTTGGGGWKSPIWLVVVVALLAALGLAGVLWSEQALRRRRS